MQKRYCSVRFDDICPSMDWGKFETAMELMKEFGIFPLLGVIPDNRDPEQMIDDEKEDFWRRILLLQQEGCTIAMHGYQHVYDSTCRGIISLSPKSEFAGHSFEVQCQKIKAAKEEMENHGIFTDVFFAPSHTYDIHTLDALRENGFHYISDGRSNYPYIHHGIKCIPCKSFSIPKNTSDYISIAVCHTSQWRLYPDRMEKLKDFCKNNKETLVSFSNLLDLPEKNSLIQRICEKVYLIYYDGIRRRIASNSSVYSAYRRLKW